MQRKHSAILIIVLCVMACSTYVNPVFPTPQPTIAPSETPSVMPTVAFTPMLMPTATRAPTETWTPTPTPSIYEATPLGGEQPHTPIADYWQGLPSGTMYKLWFVANVRDCPDRSCTSLDRYGIGKTIEVYARYHIFGSEDEWFCLEELDTVDKETHCHLAVAYKYQGQQLGEIIWP